MTDDAQLEWFADVAELIRVERVDGVLVAHAHAPGPVRASLMFRVGAADEAPPQRGLTHLVEHLAMRGQPNALEHQNGMTGATVTQFVVSGSEEQVVEFLNRVCAALRDLSLDGLEAERSLLAIESQRREASQAERLLWVRYGATALARGAMREFGAETATAEDVRAWALRWFVRENAALWITSERIPAGLDLRLPRGELQPFVLPPSVQPRRPLWFEGPPGAAIIDSIVPRTSGGALFGEVLNHALFRQLRVEQGLSYTAHAQYEPLDARSARIFVLVDAQTESTGTMVSALVDAIQALRDGRFDPADLAVARQRGRDANRQAVAAPGSIAATAAYSFLLGGAPISQEDLGDWRDHVTESELKDAASAFWDEAIWMTPAEPAPEVARVPNGHSTVVDGANFFHTDTGDRFVLGETGVSVVAANGAWTIDYADCALALQWADGGRFLLGRDGTSISLEPASYRLFGRRELDRLDAGVPPEAVVRLPARTGKQLPPEVVSINRRRGFGVWAALVGLPLLALAVVFFLLGIERYGDVGLPDRNGAIITESSARGMVSFAAIALAASATLIWGWIIRLRARARWR